MFCDYNSIYSGNSRMGLSLMSWLILKGPFTEAIFVAQLNAIFVAPKLHQVSNMFETPAISRRFYRS